MRTLDTLRELEKDTFNKSYNMRSLAKDKNAKKNKSFELIEKQNEIYKKHSFYKGLLKYWKEEKKNENK